jgi:hypothetical protein
MHTAWTRRAMLGKTERKQGIKFHQSRTRLRLELPHFEEILPPPPAYQRHLSRCPPGIHPQTSVWVSTRKPNDFIMLSVGLFLRSFPQYLLEVSKHLHHDLYLVILLQDATFVQSPCRTKVQWHLAGQCYLLPTSTPKTALPTGWLCVGQDIIFYLLVTARSCKDRSDV